MQRVTQYIERSRTKGVETKLLLWPEYYCTLVLLRSHLSLSQIEQQFLWTEIKMNEGKFEEILTNYRKVHKNYVRKGKAKNSFKNT